MITASTVAVDAPQYRVRFKGNRWGDIDQFLGVQFGTIPGRWRKPEPVRDYGASRNVDCTRPGVQAPQYEGKMVSNLTGLPLDFLDKFSREDEFRCLNLKLTRPANIDKNTKLPVLIWIHGGGNQIGSAYARIDDPSIFVRNSIRFKQPVIVVNIQYRLGIFGFGCVDDAGPNGEPPAANFGLDDQRIGIEWVKDNISVFGGDPANMTLVGVSAGGAAVAAHARTNGMDKLVRRVIIMSGTDLTVGIRPVEETRKITRGQLEKKYGVCSPEDARKLTTQEVKYFCLPGRNRLWTAYSDDGRFGKLGHFDAIMICDCRHDGALFRAAARRKPFNTIKPQLEQTEVGQALLKSYKFDGSKQDYRRVIRLLNDYVFSGPSQWLYEEAQTEGIPTFRLLFDAPNPWYNKLGAHHVLNTLYLFGNHLPPHAGGASRKFQHIFTEFMYGTEVWLPSQACRFSKDGVEYIDPKTISRYRRVNNFDDLRELERVKVMLALRGVL